MPRPHRAPTQSARTGDLIAAVTHAGGIVTLGRVEHTRLARPRASQRAFQPRV